MKLKRGLLGILSIVMLFSIALFGGCKSEIPSNEEAQTQQGGGAIVSSVESAGIELMSVKLMSEDYDDYGVSAQAETAYTLTVVPIPSDAQDTYIWTLSDTTNLSITVSSDTKSATVSCISAFGTTATITVKSSQNADVYATTSIDYVKRVSSIAVSVSPAPLKFGTTATTHTVTVTPTYGVGTLTPDGSSVSGVLKSNLGASGTVQSGTTIYSTKSCNLTFTGKTFSLKTPYEAFVSGYNEREDITLTSYRYAGKIAFVAMTPVDQLKNLYNNDFILKTTGTTSDGTLTISYTYTYGGETFGTMETSIGVAFDITSIQTLATAISLDGGSLVF